ncbi:MAG: hypothetical protein M1837_002653 [Sclerophora amabilis]|nr:MAG: hypothetical protein M1837_002653 [Sclerophora amabilis]
MDSPPKERLERGTLRDEAYDPTLAILSLVKEQDEAHPIHWSTWKKWAIIIVYNLFQILVAMTSTSYLSIESSIQETLGGSTQVVTLGQSLYIAGNAIGPALLGPLSDIGGRKWVYVASSLCFALLNTGSALALNLPMLIIFQLLCGMAGSTGLSNVAGTIADLFGDADNAGQPMALFVGCSGIGPSLGAAVGQWIASNPNMGIPWVFWINVIFGGFFALVMCFLPETLPRFVISRAGRQDNTTDPSRIALMDAKINVSQRLRFVATMALRILATEPIVAFLACYNGFAYGLTFLYLDGVFDVFVVNNGLSYIQADLTYLNFVVGVIVMFCFMPVQTFLFKRDRIKRGNQSRPEARLLSAVVAVWLFPISLFWFAFTSDGNTSYWSPVVAGAVLGFSNTLLYLSMLNFLTDSYPKVAASAVAAFLIPSFTIAAACAHIGIVMFAHMSTTWAMATLGFISLGLVALINVLFIFGPKIRARSSLARSF